MNVIDNDKLSATIKTALADAQARGVVLEDHAAVAIHDILHGALLEATTDVSVALKPVLEALAPVVSVLADIQMTLNMALRESLSWRQMFERINLSPPEKK